MTTAETPAYDFRISENAIIACCKTTGLESDVTLVNGMDSLLPYPIDSNGAVPINEDGELDGILNYGFIASALATEGIALAVDAALNADRAESEWTKSDNLHTEPR